MEYNTHNGCVLYELADLLFEIYSNFFIIYCNPVMDPIRTTLLLETNRFLIRRGVAINVELIVDYIPLKKILQLPSIMTLFEKERLYPSKGIGFPEFPLHCDIKLIYCSSVSQ